ncbi:LysE family translocator [Natronomonas sp. EA1]|uniref:LysE family translocator n=1 Tax=Natronomonas sp. EA1 TaxID=3421655 RepID=UPI003EC0F12E
MFDALTTLLAGTVFGLALAAPPGPMNAIIAEESVVRGRAAGVKAGLGAATADFVFFLLALGGVVAVIERLPLLHAAMVGVGGLLMLYFAYGAYADAAETFQGAGTVEGESKGFRKAFVLALTNPYQILFWLTVGVGLLEPGTRDLLALVSESLAGLLVVQTGSPALLVGLFLGIGIWITGFPAALTAAERRVNRLAPVVATASALVLAGFGVFFLADAAGTLSGLL